MRELMSKRKKRAISVMMNTSAPQEVQDRAFVRAAGYIRSLRAKNIKGSSYVSA